MRRTRGENRGRKRAIVALAAAVVAPLPHWSFPFVSPRPARCGPRP